MNTIKLIVTHRGNLLRKYGDAGVKRIDHSVAAVIKSDAGRGIDTHYLHLDDREEMARYGVRRVPGQSTPQACKKAIDRLFSALSPDYLMLLGAGDVIPYFLVENPSFSAGGDNEQQIPTDNPYGCSRPFSVRDRRTYLIQDRVIGRVPDLPGSNDPAPLLDYLASSRSWTIVPFDHYDGDFFLCCNVWKKSGQSCVTYLSRNISRLTTSPPASTKSRALRNQLGARLHMIKCHGMPLDGSYYGQHKEKFPPALTSSMLLKQDLRGVIAGAMCCYGAALFNPDDPAVVTPGLPPIASVYLRRGAYGFVGSTSIAWVGNTTMLCADWIVASYLREVLRGASLGRALLDAKQFLVKWANQQGRVPNLAEEKSLLQFHLLGDPSIHVALNVDSNEVANFFCQGGTFQSATLRPLEALLGSPDERRFRRSVRHKIAEELRNNLPVRKRVKRKMPEVVLAALKNIDIPPDFEVGQPIVQRVRRPYRQPELTVAGMSGMAAPARKTSPIAYQQTYQYYWILRSRKTSAVVDARMIKVEIDKNGAVIRTTVLISA